MLAAGLTLTLADEASSGGGITRGGDAEASALGTALFDPHSTECELPNSA